MQLGLKGLISEYKTYNLKRVLLIFTTRGVYNRYYKANEEASAVNYTVIKHSGHLSEHLRNMKNTYLRLVFSTFPSCSSYFITA